MKRSILTILCVLVFVFIYHDVKSQDISTGLVAHYQFENIANNEVTDAAGGDHTGTVLGSGTTIDNSGKVNNAIQFNGSGYIDIPNKQGISGNTEFTLSAWVKPSVLGSHKTIMSLTTSGRDFVFKFYNTTLQVHHYNGIYQFCNISDAGVTNEWMHVLCTWKNNQWKVYKNGVLGKTCDKNAILWNSSILRIASLGTGERFVGSMDEIRIYNRALTDIDILELYNTENGTVGGGTVTSVNTFTGEVELYPRLNNDSLYITGSSKVYLPYGHSDILTINGGTGISGGGSGTTVSLNAETDSAYWNAGSIQDFSINSSASPVAGQVLKFKNNQWTPSDDLAEAPVSDVWKQNGTDIYAETGNIGIGTSDVKEKLTVKGKILAQEIIVDLAVPGPDYVFADDYDLQSIDDLEKFVKENHHLPEIPPARKIEKEGVKVSELNMMLLKRLEELTLYMIDQEKRLKKLEQTNN